MRSWFLRTPSSYRGPNGPCSLREGNWKSSPCSGSEYQQAGTAPDWDGLRKPAGPSLRRRERQWHELRRHVPGRSTSISNLRGRQVRAQREDCGDLREHAGCSRARTEGRCRVRQAWSMRCIVSGYHESHVLDAGINSTPLRREKRTKTRSLQRDRSRAGTHVGDPALPASLAAWRAATDIQRRKDGPRESL